MIFLTVGSSSNGLEAYIHRSGRTGRAGKIGSSIVIDNGAEDSGIEDVSADEPIINFQLSTVNPKKSSVAD